jgi:hypothetical protein
MIGWYRRALRPLATTFGGLIGRARARPNRFTADGPRVSADVSMGGFLGCTAKRLTCTA